VEERAAEDPRISLAEDCLFFRTTNQTKITNKTKMPAPIGMPTLRPTFAPEERPDDDWDVAVDAANIVVAINAADEPDSSVF
jgi:hypothetical protein